MDTNYTLPDEVLKAAEQLADAILQAEPVAAYQQARARLDGDAQARELLEHFIKTQSELRRRQSRNAVTQSDVDDLRALQRQVQANRIIVDYAETQQAAIAFLPSVNQEISQLLGVDFASLAGPSSC
ncbi:MAG TPA: YlbF family regulator [Anaerolineales bacterium]